jgi:MFS family permease
LSNVLEKIDKAKWNLTLTLAFVSIAIGFLMWGIITTIGILVYPQYHNVFYLIFISAMPLLGDLLLPRLSDISLGRKTTFFITMFLYSLGSIIFIINAKFFSSNIYIMLLAYTLAVIGVEGEVPVALSLIAELFPLKYREKMLIIIPNFDNLGAAIASFIAFLTYSISSSFTIEEISMGIIALIGTAFAIVVRLSLPESIRWLVAKGDLKKANQEAGKISQQTEDVQAYDINRFVSLKWRYTFLVLIGISQYLTYGLMAYIIADYYFTGLALTLVVLYANLGASIAGIIAMILVDRLGTRNFATFSYLGGFLTMIPIIIYVMFYSRYIPIFYVLLFFNMMFSEFGWAVRTVYEPTIMPTKSRAFLVGLVRFPIIAIYTASIYLTSSFAEIQFLIYNAVLWLVGAMASIGWHIKGYDINRLPLEKASGEYKKI